MSTRSTWSILVQIVVVLFLTLLWPSKTYGMTIFIAGDSTVQSVESKRSPRSGWGQFFYEYFEMNNMYKSNLTNGISKRISRYASKDFVIENHSKFGESVKSYYDKGIFEFILNRAQKGDYVLIEFGHNDANYYRPDKMISATEYKTYLKKMVVDCRKKGVTPVFISSISRYIYRDGRMVNYFAKYRTYMKEAAKETNVIYLPLGERSDQYLLTTGSTFCKQFYMVLDPGACAAYPNGRNDRTHTTDVGARMYAGMVASLIGSEERLSDISKHLKVNRSSFDKNLYYLLERSDCFSKKQYDSIKRAIARTMMAEGKEEFSQGKLASYRRLINRKTRISLKVKKKLKSKKRKD